ncbi:MAG: hypothetical protein PWP31_638 [Clostridia bacterium]|nr:hypothetical protein [Clostridia bacterium]
MVININARKRLVFVFFLLAAGLTTVILRLAWLQFVRGAELQEKALNNRLNVMPVAAQRGVIYDRNRHELAISIASDYIGAFPQEIKDSGRAEEIAATIGSILDIPAKDVLEKITRNTGFEFIERQVEFEKAQKIKNLKLPGIEVVPENRRYYPNGPLAAQVLGFAGVDNQGLEGIEAMYDKQLSGEPGKIVIEFDALGHEIPRATHRYIPPQNGNSIVLTIDQTIQYIAERELEKIVNSPTDPLKANIIIMDSKTGEILAMASRPAFDPNNFGKYPSSVWGNPLVRDVYEPGSCFKIITTAAALEEGIVSPNDSFYCPGYIKVGPDTINCWVSPMSHGSETFAEAVKNSCNPVFAKVALKLEEEKPGKFYDYIKAFGFGHPTGIDLTGEGTGLLIPEQQLKPINIATIGIGQGIAVTPLQLVTAVSAVANGGRLMRPHLVKEVLDEDGNVIKKIKPTEIRQVISPATAQKVAELLENVVSKGTGRNAYIPGYRVGGKTGTAQKAGPGGYMDGKYVASFVGFAPVNNPRIVCLVTIDEPKGYPYYGGTLAAPVFKRVVSDVLHYLKVPVQYDENKKDEQPPKPVTVPEVVGRELSSAKAEIEKLGLKVRFEGQGDKVIAQIPKSGAVVPAGTKIILYLQSNPNKPRVPDVSGLRVTEAAQVLEAYGLTLEPQGTGQAAEQNPVPGTIVSPGNKVRIKFYETAREVLGP